VHEFHPPTNDDRLRFRRRPQRGAAMYQSWRSLLFAHWRVEPERIQRTLPPGLKVDTFGGDAYIGIVPFFMRNIRPWWSPRVPGFSNFLELNVRTYVHDAAGTPGVWFYSLDCNQRLAVWGAKTFFHLPYRNAVMTAPTVGDAIDYRSQVERTELSCNVRYTLGHEERDSVPGSLEFFLVERYMLFAAARDGRLFTGQVHHKPYSLVSTRVESWQSNLLAPHDFGIDESKPELLHATPGVDVEVFALQSCDQNGS